MAILTANPNGFIVPVTGGTFYIDITYDLPQYPNVSQWMIGTLQSTGFTAEWETTGVTSATLKVVVDATSEPSMPTRFIDIGALSAGISQVFSTKITFTQQTNAYRGIWEDDYFSFPMKYGDSVEYEIVRNTGDVVYSGKAYKEPNATNIKINVGKIVRDNLSNHLPQTLNEEDVIYYLSDYSHTYNIKVDDVVEGTYTYYNSWAYEPVTGFSISVPIRKVVDRRQIFVYSLYRGDKYNYIITYSNSDTRFRIDSNQVLIFDDKAKDGIDTLSIDANSGERIAEFEVADTCYDYCLYYCNAFGGWDSLLIKGNVVKTDKISSHYYKKEYNNKTYQFGKTKYLNVITPTYKLYTDWFNDEEQSKMYHLYESTEVYLHNLVTNKIEPVNITDTECVYKTFTNNGKKKFYNTINVEVAQEKFRQ